MATGGTQGHRTLGSPKRLGGGTSGFSRGVTPRSRSPKPRRRSLHRSTSPKDPSPPWELCGPLDSSRTTRVDRSPRLHGLRPYHSLSTGQPTNRRAPTCLALPAPATATRSFRSRRPPSRAARTAIRAPITCRKDSRGLSCWRGFSPSTSTCDRRPHRACLHPSIPARRGPTGSTPTHRAAEITAAQARVQRRLNPGHGTSAGRAPSHGCVQS